MEWIRSLWWYRRADPYSTPTAVLRAELALAG